MEYEGDHVKEVKAVRDSLAFQHNFDPKDKRAVFVFDMLPSCSSCEIISMGMKILLGFIGTADAGHRRRRPDEHHAGLRDPADP